MAKKKDPSPVRLAVDNAELVPPPASDDGDGSGGSSRRAPPPPLPPECPVIPIGMGDGVRYYMNGSRQLVTLPVEKHTRLQIMGLFGEDADLVHEIWPRKRVKTDKDGNVTAVETIGWRPEDAAEQLLRLTAAKGIWSPAEKARGRGCWLDDEGRLIVNTGGAVLADGHWNRPGLFGDHVMVAREAIMKPALVTEPGGASGAGKEALDLLETWQWRRGIDGRLLLGWLICSLYGAALPIRPVGWIIGPKNTGKSTLQTALSGIAGGWLLSVLDPTPASIWQTLRHDCLAIGIDEAEAQEDNRRLNDLVKLARLCFSGGKLPRGGADGEVTEYVLRSAVLFSSIRQPPLLPQDASRMIVMRLDKLTDRKPPDLSAQRLRALGARLLRRAIDGWPRLAEAAEQYRGALKAVGHEGRSIEVFATALAAADVVLSDHPVDTDSAAELAAQLKFASLPEAEDDLPDEQAWLGHLLSCVIPRDGVGGRNTVAAWLRQGATGEQTPGISLGGIDAVQAEADRVLGYYGIKIIRAKDGKTEHFAVANRASGLETLHLGTHWAGRSGAIGGWKAPARDLEGAQETTQRFASGRGRGTAIPLKVAFPHGYNEPDEPVAARDEMAMESEQ